MEVTVAEYRDGNDKENRVRKITGLNKATDVTLKRGVIGSLDLYEWLDDDPQRRPDRAAHGDRSSCRARTTPQVVQTWKLLRARIIKYVSGPLNAKGTDVAMEELTLAYERLEME